MSTTKPASTELKFTWIAKSIWDKNQANIPNDFGRVTFVLSGNETLGQIWYDGSTQRYLLADSARATVRKWEPDLANIESKLETMPLALTANDTNDRFYYNYIFRSMLWQKEEENYAGLLIGQANETAPIKGFIRLHTFTTNANGVQVQRYIDLHPQPSVYSNNIFLPAKTKSSGSMYLLGAEQSSAPNFSIYEKSSSITFEGTEHNLDNIVIQFN